VVVEHVKSREESDDEKDSIELLVLASASQKKVLEGKKDLQIQRLEKRCRELTDTFEKKELEFNKNMKLYMDTNKVLTELLAKSQESSKTLEAEKQSDLFVLKSIYETAEAEYLRRIQHLKKKNADPSRKEVFDRLNSNLRNACTRQDKLSKELENATKEIQILKHQNISLETCRTLVEKRLQETILEKQNMLTQLEKTEDENRLLKNNLEQLLLQIQQIQDAYNNLENKSTLNQMMLEHESEIRIWKSKVSELQTYLDSSNQKLKLLENQMEFPQEQCLKTLQVSDHSPAHLSRGSSVETLNDL
jgi:hypothetical protein